MPYPHGLFQPPHAFAPPRARRFRLPSFPRRLRAARLPAVLLLCMVVALGGCAGKRTDSGVAPGPFVRADGSPLSPSDLAAMVRKADYILVGERHDNPADHAAQAFFLATAAQQGIRPAIGLEMLPRARFAAELERFSLGLIPLDSLPAALDWENSWGFAFSLYRPVFAAAREHGLPVYGLNIPHSVRAAFGRKGADGLDAGEKAQLPERIIPPPAGQTAMLSEVHRRHSAMRERAGRRNGSSAARPHAAASRAAAPEPSLSLERFLLVQSLWDSTMAEEAFRLRNRTGRPVAILAGVGHVEYGWGIAHRLALFDPGARILLVMPFSGERPDPESGDLFYHSPWRTEPKVHGEDIRPID